MAQGVMAIRIYYDESKSKLLKRTYTVQQIAEMLDVKPETVRRWIRNGKMKATQMSRKTGNVITGLELKMFITETPKYTANFTAWFSAVGTMTPWADLKMANGDVITICWTDKKERKKYEAGINGYTLFYDEREKRTWEEWK